MGRELPPIVTPVTTEEAWNALATAWRAESGSLPSRETNACTTAQWALETGWGKQMRNNNIGNVKATDKWTGDYTFFATSERLTPEAAAAAVAKAGQRPDGSPDVAIPEPTETDKKKTAADGKVRVMFYPPHRATKFRAFASLEEAARHQIRTLRTTFASALPFLVAGAPDPWARALHRAHYYTQNPDVYAPELSSIHADLMRRPSLGGTGTAPPAPAGEGSTIAVVAVLLGLAFVLSGGRL